MHIFSLIMLPVLASLLMAAPFEKDVIKSAAGDIIITFIGHGTLMLQWDGKVIQVDPIGKMADYSQWPKADLILVTHEHGDHLDGKIISEIRNKDALIICNENSAEQIPDAKIMKNGDQRAFAGIKINAVPAYNLVHKRSNGAPFHAKGVGNGYVLSLADKRIYIAGDTENIPEMKALSKIDIAFLPMNLPYTMTPEMVADAARAIKPAILYPYHFGDTDVRLLQALLKDAKDIEVRVRKME